MINEFFPNIEKKLIFQNKLISVLITIFISIFTLVAIHFIQTMTEQKPSRYAQFEKNITLYKGYFGKFYMVDGEKYHWTFPLEWALSHTSYSVYIDSGPKACYGCRSQGRINDVFVGYCTFCFDDIYNGTRGGRFNASSTVHDNIDKLWEAFPYMYGYHNGFIGDYVRDQEDDISELSFSDKEYMSSDMDEQEIREDEQEIREDSTIKTHISITTESIQTQNDASNTSSNIASKNTSNNAIYLVDQIEKPKLQRNNKYEEESVKQNDGKLSLILPSLLVPEYIDSNEIYEYEIGEPLNSIDLDRLAKGILKNYDI
jgi:hypothetical protein